MKVAPLEEFVVNSLLVLAVGRQLELLLVIVDAGGRLVLHRGVILHSARGLQLLSRIIDGTGPFELEVACGHLGGRGGLL